MFGDCVKLDTHRKDWLNWLIPIVAYAALSFIIIVVAWFYYKSEIASSGIVVGVSSRVIKVPIIFPCISCSMVAPKLVNIINIAKYQPPTLPSANSSLYFRTWEYSCNCSTNMVVGEKKCFAKLCCGFRIVRSSWNSLGEREVFGFDDSGCKLILGTL